MTYAVGVLAMQGAFLEHQRMLEKLDCKTIQVRKPEQIADVDGLIIPGGESTTIGKLMVQFELDKAILDRAEKGMPIWGTCAGLILLAKEIKDSQQFRLGLMDILAVRNAFGRQVDSFEVPLPIDAIGDEPFHTVFIRAPYIEKVAPNVGILACYGDKIVMARQGNFLASAFHPELTEDSRVHQYFLEMVKEAKN